MLLIRVVRQFDAHVRLYFWEYNNIIIINNNNNNNNNNILYVIYMKHLLKIHFQIDVMFLVLKETNEFAQKGWSVQSL